MLITFEGIDGAGKTTQVRLLRDYFTAKGRKVVCLREPGGTDISEAIRELLLSEKNHLNQFTELMLFEAARSDLVEKIIRPELEKGSIILCDRFYDSTTAYQGYGRQMDLRQIHNFNMTATSGLVPDITFYLDIELIESKARSHSKTQDRIENSGDDFFERVIAGFREIAKQEPERLLFIEAHGTVNETHKKIIGIIEKI